MPDLSTLIKPGEFGDGAFADTRRYEFDIKNGTIYANEIPVDICFIGDSITHFWETGVKFRDYGVVINRGIGGDMAHILAKRFEADALQLKPKVVVVLIGFNNMLVLKEFEDKTTPEFYEAEQNAYDTIVNSWLNIMDQCEKADQKVVFCSLAPTLWPPEVNTLIFKVNAKLREICAEKNIPLAEYHDKLFGADNVSMSWDYSVDGTHPNFWGYNKMEEALRPVLDKVLKG